MKRAVVNLTSLRPIWSLPSNHVVAIRSAFGDGWDVVHVSTPSSSDGDGSGGSQEAIDAAAGAEVYIGWGISREVIRTAGDSLCWVHTAAAGVGGSLTPELQASPAVITNSRGIHAEPVAEWAVAAIGFCARGFHAAVAGQAKRKWVKPQMAALDTPIRELSEIRVGLIGLGGIGRAIARRCSALGMETRAVRRRAGGRRPKGVSWIGGPDELLELASQSDVLVIAAPQTASTFQLVDSGVLAALPKGAYVLNVARGALLDEDALLVHLNSGHLAGSVLDVFATEPLPEDHPFWSHPKVFVTPHVSGVSHRFWEREMELIVDNIGRYLRGNRLRNLVNLTAGY